MSMKDLPDDNPELTAAPIKLGTKLAVTDSLRIAVAVLRVPYVLSMESGGWARFRVYGPNNYIRLTVIETLALSGWDRERNPLRGAWRTVTIPVPAGHHVEYQAFVGDVELITFEYM